MFSRKKTVEPLRISLLLFFNQAPPPYRWGRGHLFIWVGGKKSVQIITTTISHNIYFFGLQDAIVRSSRYVVVWTTKKQSKKKISIKKIFSWKKLLYFIVYGGKYAFLCMYLELSCLKGKIWKKKIKKYNKKNHRNLKKKPIRYLVL